MAFQLLYDRSSAHLFAVILRILKQRSWAEEVLQEVYLSIWNNAACYSLAKGSPMTWMIAIARNRAIDLYRREQRRHADGGGAELETLVDPNPGPFDQAVASEQARALWQCLEKLSRGQRESLLLAYRDGYNHAEISEILGCPLGTAKSWVRRAQIHLKRCLQR